MARTRTVDFLPEIFQTDTNRQFLAATLDNLVQEPQFKTTQGYIGRTVGPGVNPDDHYVIEPDKTRAVYQLEPGVVSLNPADTRSITDAITYPGILDAISTLGGMGSKSDQLMQSDYYTWDPFCDFDAFVNFAQYYWLPNGPDAVSVNSAGVPIVETFDVTRGPTGYSFSGVAGTNPTIELVRGGNYQFRVAQNQKETVTFKVSNNGLVGYTIDNAVNPTLTLVRGNTYYFNLVLRGPYPFWIKTQNQLGTGYAYNDGVTRNGSITGLVTFVVPQDAPDTLYYVSENQTNLQGMINIVDGTEGTGPGFWIQTEPGISGRQTTSPNLSTREIVGVVNNGEDLGTITFNVPGRTNQQYFYDLPLFSLPVDLITDLQLSDLQNQSVDSFIATYNGIDGITSLNNRTVIFTGDDPGIEPPNTRQLYQITYNYIDNLAYMNVTKISDIPTQSKWSIRYGAKWANTQWYKTPDGSFAQIPALTSALDTLYYQDGINSGFTGQIKLLEPANSTTIFIDDILGKKNYTSPNGVVFTNGLKVYFQGNIIPESYASDTISFECTQTTSGQNLIATYDTSFLYRGQKVIFSATTLGGLEAGVPYYVHQVYNQLEFSVSATPGGAIVQLLDGAGNMPSQAINLREYYVSGVGTSIQLLPVTDFVVPELYANDADSTTVGTQPADFDYITIDRASPDRNAWSRSNRWFHIDVIQATATYNDTLVDVDNLSKARRPIIQFRSGLKLFNMGSQGIDPVDVIDFDQTDALSNVEGATSYTVYGYQFINGTRVIFANDSDPLARNRVYEVEFIYPDTVPPIATQPVIHLREVEAVLADQSVVILNSGTIDTPLPAGETVVINGATIVKGRAGYTYWYDGSNWILAQLKTSVQQAPLFDVYDMQGVSFSDTVKYPSNNFTGSKLFSYALDDTTILDPVLRLPLKYQTIANVGDIVFDNNLYNDSFVYTQNNTSSTVMISSGTPREYSDRTTYQRLLGWQNAATTSLIYQQFRFVFTSINLQLDVAVSTRQDVPVLKIYVNGVFLYPTEYSYIINGDTTTITLNSAPVADSVIEVLALSDQTSKLGFYQVPINLQNNPFNSNSAEFTLGTVRQHYQSICENLTDLSGLINGANNTRDLGDIVPYGLVILQQSAPLTMAGYFLRSNQFNIFNSLVYNGREYTKYKNLILQNVTQQTLNFQTPAEILDTAIDSIVTGRVQNQPFYWSDMLPSGAEYQETVYQINFITTTVFNTLQTYDYTSANYLGMDVYLDDTILIRGRDYVVEPNAAHIRVLITLQVGQTLTIREYASTAGSFCPNTPTKLGLYPAWEPEIVIQTTTLGEQGMIIGHDGSATPVFGDIRDQVLLEFERRIYNNLKLDDNPVPLTMADVLPGEFRRTGFTNSEIQTILNQDFLSYVAWNKLDYTRQEYISSNEFTYNYNSSQSLLDNGYLPGAWRGINRFFYDTQQPQDTAWEMLGFSRKPDWWDLTYGPEPYTNGNFVLWDDLEAGIVRDPLGAYVNPLYVRPGLTQVIPSGSEGELLPPLQSVVGTYDAQQFEKNWSLGDGGPVEASWWNSSLYPFAVMRVLALTRPAKFFSLFADRDLYKYDTEFNQYLYNGRYRLDASNLEIYGNGVSKASFIDWIVDYNRQTGLDSTTRLHDDLANLDVRLCYRMASFSDPQYIQLTTERSTPGSTNTGFVIPPNSYDLLLYKNQVFAETTYSSVMVQRVDNGYQIFGYSTLTPYFTAYTAMATSTPQTFSAGGVTVRISTVFSNQTQQIPYSNIFADESAVAEFLLGYGRWLESQGFVFDTIANGYVLDWTQMVVEFLYWSGQGWGNNSLINLNPLAQRLQITREQSIVDSIVAQTADNILLDQNRRELPTRNLNIVRLGNTFTVEPLTDQSLSFIDLRYTSYEHMIVLNNRSEFGDLIYDPITGARQFRLSLRANTTTQWNGSVDAQGFILNQDNIQEWTGLRTYSKGELVKHKGSYWSAATIVQPSTTFNYNDWLQSDYTRIQQGLLPNLANKSTQLQITYDINQGNLDPEEDLFSFGLIGFQPRQYLAALNLDEISQLNVYRQFLGSKGTLLSVENLRSAQLSKEQADYDVYENWAIQRAVYGANANRCFFELRLNSALLTANPSTIQIINAGQFSPADQSVPVGTIWRESFKITSPDVLPTTTQLPTDTGLPTAGYVNLDEVDVTVFDINDVTSLSANLSKIHEGSTIWAAKVNEYDWNIYRADSVPGTINHLCDNLDGTSLVIFTKQHNLQPGNKLIVRFFDSAVDGVYTVLTVPSLETVTIAYSFPPGGRSVIDGTGLGFTLNTMRVAQFSDLVNLPYANQLVPGARAWIDDNGSGRWAVYEKQDIYQPTTTLTPQLLDATEQYGSSVSMGADQQAALVGSPRYGFGTGTERGAVYTYVKNYSGTYQPVSPTNGSDALLILGATGVRHYGTSVDFGNLDWAVSGAPASLSSTSLANAGYAGIIYRDPSAAGPGVNPYSNYQLLTTPGDVAADQAQFGWAVAMSDDERWLYVSAPDQVHGEVHAYTRVQWQNQSVTDKGDGITKTFAFSDHIQISLNTQIFVTVDGALQTLGVDYTVDAGLTQVTFAAAPFADTDILIQRRNLVSLNPTSGPVYNIKQYFFQVDLVDSDIYSFQVLLNGELLRANIDYTFNTGTKALTVPGLVPTDSLVVRAEFYWRYVDTIVPPTPSGTLARFGYSLACTTDGRQVLIGALNQDVNGQVEAGAVYVYDRDVQRFHYGETSTVTFTVLGSAPDPLAVSVLVNNKFLTPETSALVNTANSFSISGNNITVNTDLAIGDFVDIETNQFSLVQVIDQQIPAEFSNFGESVDICRNNCSLYVGAPQSSLQIFKGGVVEREINQSRLFGSTISTIKNPTVTPGDTLRVNNQDVVVPAAAGSVSSLQGLIANINAEVPNVSAVLIDGLVQITVNNFASAPYANKLQVAPGTVGTTFDDLGFDTFVFAQTIQSPYPVSYAKFGGTLTISDTATELLVSATRGTTYLVQIFDTGLTEFDAGATIFFSATPDSGAVYVFDYLPPAAASATSPGAFILGQQIGIPNLESLDALGTALSYRNGVLMMGAPGSDLGDSSSSDYGRVYIWQNPTRESAWKPLHVQAPVVDVRLLNGVYLYNLNTLSTTDFLDFFDPLQGKILGAAQQNIDFISAIDPASYNAGPVNLRGTTWAQDHVGQVWWDISTVRFVDPAQDNIVYAARQWGQVFPGSSVDVYQWIVSDTPPAAYTGPGTVHNNLSYSINSVLTPQGNIQTQYFFWVRGLTTTATNKGKTLPVSAVAQYIENPRLSGIAYLAALDANTVAIYNCAGLLEAQDTVLHIEFDRELNDDNIHVEYELIPQGRADGWISDNLYRKLLDSFCGVDTAGNLVPDPTLSPAEQYGVQFRPRQSMFNDRFAALRNYIIRANTVMAQYPISEMRSFALLNSQEPIPATNSGAYNFEVANLEVLSYQNIYTVPLGYRYLVLSDSSEFGLWSIYEVGSIGSARQLQLVRVQNYRTSDYWSYIDWYRPGYNPSTRCVLTVPNYATLSTITVPVGSSVRVSANSQGQFEIYLLTDTGWERVALQNGTIAINNSIYDYVAGGFGYDTEVYDARLFDQAPTTETRKILQALNEEIFIDELLIERNNLLMLTFDLVLQEFAAPQWLVKTSLIDVDHRVRGLLPFPNYQRDNQEFVSDYIQEVKPYHVQVREFNLRYSGLDQYSGDDTDFDVPAYWNTDLVPAQYTSPVLMPYAQSQATGSPDTNNSNAEANNPIWTQWPWSQWYNNFLLSIESIDVFDGGLGYVSPPTVTIEGDALLPTLAEAIIDDLGSVIAVNITRAGSGYRTQPVVVFSAGGTITARAYARMTGLGLGKVYNSSTIPDVYQQYNLARSVRVNIKFDRYQYQSQVEIWSPDGTYADGTLVRYDDRVWRAQSQDSTQVVGPTFDLENWVPVPASSLGGVDRTQGFYVAGVNAPGLDLPLLIDGIDYPAEQVWGEDFQATDPLNTIYSSSFADIYLGTRPTDINVDGGKYLGLTEGHAPQELVNGSEFDTLDLRVYTRPGADWTRSGHGFSIGSRIFQYDTNTDSASWDGILSFVAQVLVSNTTTNRDLALGIDYAIDWVNRTVSILPSSNVNYGDNIDITVYGAGGGNQLYRVDLTGADLVDNQIIIPVNAAEINSIMLLLDGQASDLYQWEAWVPSESWNINNSYDQNILVNDLNSFGTIYFRSIQPVPAGITLDNLLYWQPFVPQQQSIVTIDDTITASTGISLVALGLDQTTAGDFVVGRSYTITSVGTTNWISIGAASNTVGVTFVATGVGTGTGQATTVYGWSTPQVQYQIADSNIVSSATIMLTNSLEGTNPANLVVTRNGLRLTPAAGIEWIGDGTSHSFGLPQRLGYDYGWNQSNIDAATDVQVWVDSILQIQGSGSIVGDYSVTNWSGSNTPGRQVVFVNPPADGAQVLISVSTRSDYVVVDNQLEIRTGVNLGDVFAITTWNDTSQQNALTQCFYGPVPQNTPVIQGYDSTNYDPDFVTAGATGIVNAGAFLVGETYTIVTVGTTDFMAIGAASNTVGVTFVAAGTPGTNVGSGTGTASGTVYSRSSTTDAFNNTSGSFDYSTSALIYSNEFDLGRAVPANRVWATLDGQRLFEGEDFVMQGSVLVLNLGTIKTNQILAVTIFTNSVVPETAEFRVFQDMRGVQATYRITQATTTRVTAPIAITDDVIYVENAAALTAPALALGVFGVVTIGGERITYRERNLTTNSISGLRRGTAGTAADSHNVGDSVYSMGRGNLLEQQYQDYYVSDTGVGDGSTSVFYAPSITTQDFGDSSTIWVDSIEVYVGGVRQYRAGEAGNSTYHWIATDFDPVAIEFVALPGELDPQIAPPPGVEVVILQRRGTWWYSIATPAERAESLQENPGVAARFLTDR